MQARLLNVIGDAISGAISWIDGIKDGFISAVGQVIGGIFKFFLNWIIFPIIQVITLQIKYTLSGLWYSISVFLLKIIDFLQALFRAFAGLASEEAGDSFWLTLKDSPTEGGDLLIQLLMSDQVLYAFEATAIVGIFLLIITTIFQMIKVEYTTEGAENNKTKILGKSLKSLTNLLLIPALCVFGVFIGNQILDLIDTATSGTDRAKISGSLFAAAAAEAQFTNPHDYVGKFCSEYVSVFALNPYAATSMLGQTIALYEVGTQYVGDILSSVVSATQGTSKNESDRILADLSTSIWKFVVPESAEITIYSPGVAMNAFKSGDANYANLGDVADYYNVFKINYFLLILGASTVIKCLVHVSFGLVDRLYRCVALFIVAPFVIGMSPIKDSLGSWRSNFIGKALAAYGTVISMNLFFTIISVMLNVEVGVDSYNSSASAFYTGLVKMIFIIVGCLMIEKLAAEMGNYFGASDGLATGKGLKKEIDDSAKKAATTAAGIALGVATMGVGAAAGGMALAGKIGAAAQAAGGGKAGIKAGFNVIGGSIKDATIGKVQNAMHLKGNKEELDQVSGRRKTAKEVIQKQEEYVKSATRYEDLFNKGKNRTDAENKEYSRLKKQYKFKHETVAKEKEKAQNNLAKLKSDDAADAAREKDLETKIKTGETTRAWATTNYAAAKNFGMKTIAGLVVPKVLMDAGKGWKKEQEEGVANSDYLKAQYDVLKEARSDKAKDKLEKDPIVAAEIGRQQRDMREIAEQGYRNSVIENQHALNNNVLGLGKDLDRAADRLAAAIKSGDKDSERYYRQQAEGIQDQMLKINGHFTFDSTSMRATNSSEAIDLANARIQEELAKMKKIFVDNQNKDTKAILKALEEYMAEVGKNGDNDLLKALKQGFDDLKSQITK